MIKIGFELANPFTKDNVPHKHYAHMHKKLTTNKSFEFEAYRESAYNVFSFSIDARFRGHNHAGFGFEFELYGFCVGAKIYDRRHWDYKKGTWIEYGGS